MTRLLYGAGEIAASLGLTRRQIYTMVDRGMPHLRNGRTIIARADKLEAWLAEREVEASRRGASMRTRL